MVIIRSYLRIFVIGIVSSRHARDVGKYCKRLEPVRLSVEIRSNTKFLRKIPDIYVSSNTIRGKVSIPTTVPLHTIQHLSAEEVSATMIAFWIGESDS